MVDGHASLHVAFSSAFACPVSMSPLLQSWKVKRKKGIDSSSKHFVVCLSLSSPDNAHPSVLKGIYHFFQLCTCPFDCLFMYRRLASQKYVCLFANTGAQPNLSLSKLHHRNRNLRASMNNEHRLRHEGDEKREEGNRRHIGGQLGNIIFLMNRDADSVILLLFRCRLPETIAKCSLVWCLWRFPLHIKKLIAITVDQKYIVN